MQTLYCACSTIVNGVHSPPNNRLVVKLPFAAVPSAGELNPGRDLARV